MQIEYIDNNHKFFSDVKQLGRKNAATLGFMPEGGFDDHARKRCIIIAYDDSGLCGYLMFRKVPRKLCVSIVHLCISDECRGKCITTELLNTLKDSSMNDFSGIALSCRTDYERASQVWSNYGFIPKGIVRSRSIAEHYLYKWWYDFNKPDLFSSIELESSKFKALLDVNVIAKLRDSHITHSPSENPRGLMADWLVNETEFYFAPETYIEISRDKDADRLARTRLILGKFIEARHNVNERRQVSKELSEIMKGASENDKSDRTQIATCIVVGIPYFITFDQGIIDKRSEIELRWDIEIYTPQEFIIEIDSIIRKDEYSPIQLKGIVSHSVSKITSSELSICIDNFIAKHCSERKQDFKNIVSEVLDADGNVELFKKDGCNIAFWGYIASGDELIISFIRILNAGGDYTVFMQLLSESIYKSIAGGCCKISIKEMYFNDTQKNILNKMGFELIESQQWVKYVCNGVAKVSDLENIHSSLGIDTSKIQYDRLELTQLITAEQRLYPLKLTDLDIPCYIIPIKAYWAEQLFDYKSSGETLFGADANKLWNIENVYYRSAKPSIEVAPARILWYVSCDKKTSRSKAIVATSYLDGVYTDKPKELFRKNQYYGIYKWDNVFKTCDRDINKNIRMLRFSLTEVFDYPISFRRVNTILKNNGRKPNTFTSPMEMSKEIFTQIYEFGKWGK